MLTDFKGENEKIEKEWKGDDRNRKERQLALHIM